MDPWDAKIWKTEVSLIVFLYGWVPSAFSTLGWLTGWSGLVLGFMLGNRELLWMAVPFGLVLLPMVLLCWGLAFHHVRKVAEAARVQALRASGP